MRHLKLIILPAVIGLLVGWAIAKWRIRTESREKPQLGPGSILPTERSQRDAIAAWNTYLGHRAPAPIANGIDDFFYQKHDNHPGSPFRSDLNVRDLLTSLPLDALEALVREGRLENEADVVEALSKLADEDPQRAHDLFVAAQTSLS